MSKLHNADRADTMARSARSVVMTATCSRDEHQKHFSYRERLCSRHDVPSGILQLQDSSLELSKSLVILSAIESLLASAANTQEREILTILRTRFTKQHRNAGVPIGPTLKS